MAYGEQKGRKDAGDYSAVDMFGLSLASAIGIVVATFFDLTQSDEASALFLFNQWLATATETLGLSTPPLYAVVLILMAVGASSIFFLQPVTLRGAFAQGFGVLAAITTVAPSNLGSAMPGAESGDFAPLPAASLAAEPFAQPAVMELDGAVSAMGLSTPIAAWSGTATAAMMQSSGYSIRIQVEFPNGLAKDPQQMIREGSLRGRLHNSASGMTYSLFRTVGANLQWEGTQRLRIVTRIPGDASSAEMVARIEAEGYRIIEDRFNATQGVNGVWTITMQPSNTPLVLQRFRRSYTF